MYILYGGGYTRAHMIEMVFAEIDQPFELEIVDTLKGDNKSPWFLQINPTGFVPALRGASHSMKLQPSASTWRNVTEEGL